MSTVWAGPRLPHTTDGIADDGSRTIQRLSEIASYADAELVFRQVAIDWPGGRILWRNGVLILRDSGPKPHLVD